jgi:hypothetical protein
VTKSGVRRCRPRQGRGFQSRARAGSGRGEGGGGETAIDLYMTLGPPAGSLKAGSSSEGLGRPGGLGGELRDQATPVS